MFSKSNFQYSDCLYLKPEHWRWNFAQQISQMMHLSPLSSSQSSSHSWHFHCSSSLLLILPIYNLFLLETFFCCLLLEADDSSFSSSLEKILVVIPWPGSTFLPLFFACLFRAPIPQFSFRTFNTDLLKENSFTLEVPLQLGNLFNTWFLSKGHKPLARKPDTKLVDFRHLTN